MLALLSNFGNVWLVAGLGLIALVQLQDPLTGAKPWRKRLAWALAALLIAFGAQQACVARGAVAVDDAAAPPSPAASALARAETAETVETVEAKIALLQVQLAEARAPKAFDLNDQLHTWADEVGLGLGWAIVYFALLPVWWNGQTIGKRLLGLRVVELTGKPITAMLAFKRYGGYAAGMATGLFGFAQVLWDPNRQAIQDKTAHTVVIDLRRKLIASNTPPNEDAR